MESPRLVEILRKQKVASEADIINAIKASKESGEPVLKILIDLGLVDETTVARVVAELWEMPFIDIISVSILPDVLATINQDRAKRYGFMVFARDGAVSSIAVSDPTNIELMDYLYAVYGDKSKIFVATSTGIFSAIEKYFTVANSVIEASKDASPVEIDDHKSDEVSIEQLREMGADAPVIRLVNSIITQAIAEKASDIHIEPQKDSLRIRYREDGILSIKQNLPKNIQPGVISRFKIMANMDIAERRKPQDGRISLRIENRAIDFRVNSLPTIFGEKIVLRILDKSGAQVPLEKLGFLHDTLEQFNQIISQPYGMILISGPTGAGKTTTLYSILNRLNTSSKNIVTVEDPIEYQLDGLNQVQVNVKADMTFANALRSILRQDPNIVLIGEIRDGETAQIAIEAALTGHLVLATIHTNDAPSVATRLIDMGIEPFLIASSLIGATAQRLARTICPYCREEYHPSSAAIKGLGIAGREMGEDTVFYRGKGCDKCNGTGYKGRTGIHELMKVDDDIRKLIIKKASAREISDAARANGMRTLLDDALIKAQEQIITLDEVLRVVSTSDV